jgi:hypothetical protein
MTYRYTDPNGGRLEVTPAIHLIDGQLAVEFFIPLATTNPVQAGRVRIPVDRIEELVAGLRDTARQAATAQAPAWSRHGGFDQHDDYRETIP